MEFLRLAGIGLALGITTAIPGVSTGTIAVVFNVYYRLIGIITPDIRKIFAAWKFWLPLVIGGMAGIFFFSKVITFLFSNYYVSTNWFFIGIIIGSLPMVYRNVRRPDVRGSESAIPAFSSIVSGVIALAIMVVMAVFKPAEESSYYTVLTPQLFGILAAGGMLAAIAMIIPGISGSFLLLVIGLYRTIVQAVSDINLSLILPVALGALIGVLAGAALVRFLLKKAPKETYGAVLGLVAGSVLVLYPGGLGSGATVLFSVLSMITGAAVSFILGRKTKEDI